METLESSPAIADSPAEGTRCFCCEQYLREAQLLQSSLLPAGPLAEDAVELAYRFSPFSEVSGDFADFFCLPDGRIGLYLGDVVGKGLPAAMYGALVMGALRGIHKTGTSASRVLALLNERLMQRPLNGRLCSTLYAAYDPVSRILEFSNAGVPRPLLVSANGCRPLGEGGLPSGMFPGAIYDRHITRLSPGDSVLFATDGVHELRNAEDVEFGEGHVIQAWASCRQRSAHESVNFLFDCLQQFSGPDGQHDDVTVVVLRVPQ
ncbi:MAG TPA: PP2C family protein-serine/threonine phosphatase [Terriglobales bacterium]|nr:PP2C family protein-serine/threonine phosphatase [Terriglobales bacterium]